MGAFYGNITLKGPSQAEVAESLRGRRAVVSPRMGDFTVAFDAVVDAQDLKAIEALTAHLSRVLDCPALAVIVHDDDVLLYFLYRGGVLSDRYNSHPSYFGSARKSAGPAGGKAAELCLAFDAANSKAVAKILGAAHGRSGYTLETDRHRDLVSALSLPDCAVGTAFESFEQGGYPDGLLANSVLRAPDPPPVEDPRLRRDREFYEKLGPEDLSRPCRKEGCPRGAILHSVFCRSHHFEMIERRDYPFDH